MKIVTTYVEPSLATAQPDDKFQFERFGYLVADRVTGLKDSWGK